MRAAPIAPTLPGDELLQLALKRVPAPILVLDAAGTVAWCTDVAAATLGRRRDEIEGRDWRSLTMDLGEPDVKVLEEALFSASEQSIGTLLTLETRGDELLELRQVAQRKDEFLAVLAHELRNPLAPLRNGLHLARIVGTGDSGLKSLLCMMERQIGVLTRLVDDLLDVGRIGSGKLQLSLQPIALRTVVHEGCELMTERLAATAHRLVLTLCDEPCTMAGDSGRLEQVLVNLISNAAKYSDPGSDIRVELRRESDRAVISITDDGVGLRAAELAEVFNMYSQVRLHKARAQGGLGIGLALVRRLVELHGGTVDATSDGPGRGSTFSVRLPLRVSAASSRTGLASAPPS